MVFNKSNSILFWILLLSPYFTNPHENNKESHIKKPLKEESESYLDDDYSTQEFILKSLLILLWDDGSKDSLQNSIDLLETVYWKTRYQDSNRLNGHLVKQYDSFFQSQPLFKQTMFNQLTQILQTNQSCFYELIQKFNNKYLQAFPTQRPALHNVIRKHFDKRSALKDRFIEYEDKLCCKLKNSFSVIKQGNHSLLLGSITIITAGFVIILGKTFCNELSKDLYTTIKTHILNKKHFDQQKTLSLQALNDCPNFDDLLEGFDPRLQAKIQKLYTDISTARPGFVAKVQLEGPPGTGKTVLARSLAKKIQANYHEFPGSFFIEGFINASSKKIRDTTDALAQDIKKSGSKPVVIFFDEIDSLARKRSMTDSCAASDDTKTLLSYTNGLNALEQTAKACGKKLIIISATNLPENIDPAADRRKEYRLEMQRPSFIEIKKVLSKGIKPSKLSDNDLSDLSRNADGMGYGHLQTLINEISNHASKQSTTIMADALSKIKELKRTDKYSITSTTLENDQLVQTLNLSNLLNQSKEEQLSSLEKLVSLSQDPITKDRFNQPLRIADADKDTYKKWHDALKFEANHINARDTATSQTFIKILKALDDLKVQATT